MPEQPDLCALRKVYLCGNQQEPVQAGHWSDDVNRLAWERQESRHLAGKFPQELPTASLACTSPMVATAPGTLPDSTVATL